MKLFPSTFLVVLLLACPSPEPDPMDDDDALDDDDAVDDDDAAPVGAQLGWSWAEGELEPALPGCPVTALLTLSNDGDETLELREVSMAGDDFTVSQPGLELLPPGGTAGLTVQWRPQHVAAASAVLTIESNDADEPTTTIVVEGTPSDRRVSMTFTAAPAPVLDLLFVIDSSACSNTEQIGLADAIPGFIDEIDGAGVDWQAAVTSADPGDAGAFVDGDWVVAADIGAAETLATRIQLGGNGSGVELGLDGAHYGLLPERIGPGGPVEGFKRAGSQLVLFFMSDEEDQSVALPRVEDYLDSFRAVAEHPERLRIYALSGGDTGCEGDASQALSGSAGASVRYPFVARGSSGTDDLVCFPDRFAGLLDVVADDTARHRKAFPVGDVPFTGSLEVLLDGNDADPTAWSFDDVYQSVLLNEGPPPGSEVELRWWPAGVCE